MSEIELILQLLLRGVYFSSCPCISPTFFCTKRRSKLQLSRCCISPIYSNWVRTRRCYPKAKRGQLRKRNPPRILVGGLPHERCTNLVSHPHTLVVRLFCPLKEHPKRKNPNAYPRSWFDIRASLSCTPTRASAGTNSRFPAGKFAVVWTN